MWRLGAATLAAVAVLATAIVLPGPSHSEESAVYSGPVTTKDAPAYVAEVFSKVFGNLEIEHPLDKTKAPLPALKAEDFRVVGETNSALVVAHEPLVGLTVRAHVDKNSGLVAFDPLFIATE